VRPCWFIVGESKNLTVKERKALGIAPQLQKELVATTSQQGEVIGRRPFFTLLFQSVI
jgi:hypothetical protein